MPGLVPGTSQTLFRGLFTATLYYTWHLLSVLQIRLPSVDEVKWLFDVTQPIYYVSSGFYFLFIDVREKERERGTCCSTYLHIHWLIVVDAMTGDQTRNLSISGWRSNQLSYPARTTKGFKTQGIWHPNLNTVPPLPHVSSQPMDHREPSNRGHYITTYKCMWNNLDVIDFGKMLGRLGFNQWVTCVHVLSPGGVTFPDSRTDTRSPGQALFSHTRDPECFAFHESEHRPLSSSPGRRGPGS